MTEYIQTIRFMVHPGTTIHEIVSIEDWFGVKVGLSLTEKKLVTSKP